MLTPTQLCWVTGSCDLGKLPYAQSCRVTGSRVLTKLTPAHPHKIIGSKVSACSLPLIHPGTRLRGFPVSSSGSRVLVIISSAHSRRVTNSQRLGKVIAALSCRVADPRVLRSLTAAHLSGLGRHTALTHAELSVRGFSLCSPGRSSLVTISRLLMKLTAVSHVGSPARLFSLTSSSPQTPGHGLAGSW